MAEDGLEVEASCAICGAPPYPECPHEGQRLTLALDQAMARWLGVQKIRDWVVDQARNQIISTFRDMKTARYQHHLAYLQTLPCYTLYRKYHGNPPVQPAQLHLLHSQMQQANAIYRAGIDEDWKRSCLRYPEVLDYYFSLVEISFPNPRDASMADPRFGVKRVKQRRDSVDEGSTKSHRKKDRRGRTPPPVAPMAPRR